MVLREKIESKEGNWKFGAGLSVKLFASLSRVGSGETCRR